MIDENEVKIPIWFWIIAIFALIWNLMGIGSFIGLMSASKDSLLAYPDVEQELFRGYPTWVEVVYAVATLSGVLASIALLLRQRWAKLLFGLSLVAIIIQMIYNLIAITSLEIFSPEAVILPVFIVAAAIFYFYFSYWSIKKGWIH
ncbi:hypothetical protein HX109_08255 [Galbibacter sp. BG1]|uniref:hypothetical protein n=1 Tax=Galbibacter sp. BG1 TaxID=1170699 RepID=UPI0015BFA730|nr:hypothetical protein [Galbibacter sp. BG1]QLE01557.1 hypothetical protein HX109_08255 [Galbibacter sp. BG1]